MPSKKIPRQRREPSHLLIPFERTLQREIPGVLLIAIGSMTALTLLSITKGALSETWVIFLRSIFGWGVYLVPLLLIGGGLLLLWEGLWRYLSIPMPGVLGLEMLFLASLGLSHLLLPSEKAFQLAEKGKGGGYIGWTISYFLITAVGRGASFLVLLSMVCAGLVLLLRPSWNSLKLVLDKARTQLGALILLLKRVKVPPAVLKQKEERPGKPLIAPKQIEVAKLVPANGHRLRRERGLPPLDLLNGGTNEPYGDADTRYKKQVIEETLMSFGVPAKVVEVNQGPTVTQFGVEPGFLEYEGPNGKTKRRKVKVSKIIALQDDLALALAVTPIRIEAPVPGRSVIGIEVPNTKASLVSLRSVIESKAFRSIKSKLRIALGQDVAGQPVAADLAQMPHLLIAGATGSGKSMCINSITACLLLNNTPDDLRLIMIDPKMVELINFNGVPHLLGPVITSVEEVVCALKWVAVQVDERYKLFARSGARNIEAYNQMVSQEEKQAYIVVLIDELADLMMSEPEEIERSICRIAQLARATGIHLVIATQRPSVDVLTGLIKANFPARISFAVTSQVDSRVILDTGGAEKLLGRGDMLYMASDSSKPVRLQGCFVSDAELERLVRFWCDKIDWIAPQPEAVAPWHEMALEKKETDELLEQAIELARERKNISTSFIQRRLRIGYPRAARLVDLMKELGIISPVENAGRSRAVLENEFNFQKGGDKEPFAE